MTEASASVCLMPPAALATVSRTHCVQQKYVYRHILCCIQINAVGTKVKIWKSSRYSSCGFQCFFRLILAMDPRYGEISRAMRNRGVEIFMLGEVRWEWCETQRVYKVMFCLCMGQVAENRITCCWRWICSEQNDRNVFPPFCCDANLFWLVETILLHWKKVFKFS